MPLLTNSGPDMDLTVRRTQFAPSELWSASLKQPKALVKKKVKNQKTNAFGETVGRLHLERQDVDKAAGRRSSASFTRAIGSESFKSLHLKSSRRS